MRKDQVPQDDGKMLDGKTRDLYYVAGRKRQLRTSPEPRLGPQNHGTATGLGPKISEHAQECQEAGVGGQIHALLLPHGKDPDGPETGIGIHGLFQRGKSRNT